MMLAFCFVGSLALLGCRAQQSEVHKAKSNEVLPPTPQQTPTGAFVTDQKMAIEIAVKAWIPIFGEQQIEEEKPYRAELTDGVWTVYGSLPEVGPNEIAVGGVANARISQKDGQILGIWHTK